MKKLAKTEAIFDRLAQLNPAADAIETSLRLSVVLKLPFWSLWAAVRLGKVFCSYPSFTYLTFWLFISLELPLSRKEYWKMKINKPIVIKVELDNGLDVQVDAANGNILNTEPEDAG